MAWFIFCGQVTAGSTGRRAKERLRRLRKRVGGSREKKAVGSAGFGRVAKDKPEGQVLNRKGHLRPKYYQSSVEQEIERYAYTHGNVLVGRLAVKRCVMDYLAKQDTTAQKLSRKALACLQESAEAGAKQCLFSSRSLFVLSHHLEVLGDGYSKSDAPLRGDDKFP